MGTNYYITDNYCNCCGRYDEFYHIGKSSAGWCFTLHVDPANGVHTLGDIISLWHNKKIINEYGKTISKKEMLSIITDREGREKEKTPYGYDSWEQFYTMNHAEPGPKNLLRHTIDGRHCIGHGDGTYDYIKGEFS